jgi:hypothetical protein
VFDVTSEGAGSWRVAITNRRSDGIGLGERLIVVDGHGKAVEKASVRWSRIAGQNDGYLLPSQKWPGSNDAIVDVNAGETVVVRVKVAAIARGQELRVAVDGHDTMTQPARGSSLQLG